VYGDIVSVKYIPVKACAFIQYKEKASGEAAIKGMNGKMFGAGKIRVSWGRAPSDMAGGLGSASTRPKALALPVFQRRKTNSENPKLAADSIDNEVKNSIGRMNEKFRESKMEEYFKFESGLWIKREEGKNVKNE
jgi:RNA recognition motif-containing protein